MSETPEELDGRRALKCLYITVDAMVADDVNQKVIAWVRAAVLAERERAARIAENYISEDLCMYHRTATVYADGEPVFRHCENYGCSDLISIAAAIRAEPEGKAND